jgi:hypothetical protein
VAVKRINMHKLLSGGSAAGDLMLRRNDIVYVNRSMIGDFKLFADYVLTPLVSAGETYIRGWYIFHLEDIYTPGRVQVAP